jgi:hypothetical protein
MNHPVCSGSIEVFLETVPATLVPQFPGSNFDPGLIEAGQRRRSKQISLVLISGISHCKIAARDSPLLGAGKD